MEIQNQPSPAVTEMSGGQGTSSRTKVMIKTRGHAPQTKPQNSNYGVKLGSKV